MRVKVKYEPKGMDLFLIYALFLVFFALKLCGVIDWPWIWVLAPLWIPLGLAIIIFIAALMYIGVSNLISNRRTNGRNN